MPDERICPICEKRFTPKPFHAAHGKYKCCSRRCSTEQRKREGQAEWLKAWNEARRAAKTRRSELSLFNREEAAHEFKVEPHTVTHWKNIGLLPLVEYEANGKTFKAFRRSDVRALRKKKLEEWRGAWLEGVPWNFENFSFKAQRRWDGRRSKVRAKERGKRVGKPPELLTDERKERILALRAKGYSQRRIATALGLSRGSVEHVLRQGF